MSDKYSPKTDAPQEPQSYPGGLIEGFVVSPSGQATQVTNAAEAKAPRGGFVWLHLSVDNARDLVERELALDPMVARGLLAEETRPRCQRLPKGTLINLRGVNFNDGCRPEDMLSLRCWLEKDRLITARVRRSVAVEELRELYRGGETHERPGQLLVDIIRRLIALIDPEADALADGMDSYEDRARKDGDDEALRDEIGSQRHDAVIYRRYLAPMRDAIARLAEPGSVGMTEDDQIEAQEQADRATRIVEELEITIQRAGVVVDQMAAARSERMNNNMMVLSVVSAIFLPLSFLTGLLGINVGGVPGTDDPQAFLIVVSVCLVLGVIAGVFFKARDWI